MENSILNHAIRVFANSVDPFIPELWAQEGLAILEENMVATNLVHRDFENQLQAYGDTVNTRRPGEFQSKRKGTNDDITLQDATSTNVAVPLNQHAEVSFLIRDVEQTWSFKDLVATYLAPALLAQARFIDQIVLGQYSQFYANFVGTPGGLTSSNAKDKILDVRNKMNINKAYVSGRNIVWAPSSETNVLKADIILQANTSGDGGAAMRNAMIDRKLGFDHYMGQNMASIGSVTTGSAGAVNHSGSYAVGTTVLVVDGFTGDAIPSNSFILIGSDPYRVVSSSLTTGNTTGITIAAPGLRSAVADNAVITPITGGSVNLSGGYAAGWTKTIAVTNPTIKFQDGQMVTFGTSASSAVYTIVDANSTDNTILLDRPLEAAISNSDPIYPMGTGDYNFAFHRNAIALVVRPLALPPAGSGARAAVVNYNGLSLRATLSYNPTKQGTQVTLDMLFGIKVLDTNLGCVLMG